jgi:hypothetical protein
LGVAFFGVAFFAVTTGSFSVDVGSCAALRLVRTPPVVAGAAGVAGAALDDLEPREVASLQGALLREL